VSSLAGKVAVVTGGGSGVGAACVEGLEREGARVIAIDLSWSRQPGAEVAAVSGDVTAAATWTEVGERARQLGGGPDHLLLCAGRLEVGSVLALEPEALRAVFEVNVFAAAAALKSCLPAMIARGGGGIVAVASTDALFAEQGLAAYCASKGALLQLIRCVAVDHGRQGIRANCVCPGAIDTPFFRAHVDAAADPEAFLEEKIQRHPSGRLLQPEDVAEVALFLLEERAVGVNGAGLLIDGGLTATFDYQATAVATDGPEAG
jgi:NAD(P)-dependent dehydrogenase (short-subunit alcohol dehydrogenase family)